MTPARAVTEYVLPILGAAVVIAIYVITTRRLP